MRKPGGVTYIDDMNSIPSIQRMPGYPTIEDLKRLANAIGPFKTEKMELVFAECMQMVMHPPMMFSEE